MEYLKVLRCNLVKDFSNFKDLFFALFSFATIHVGGQDDQPSFDLVFFQLNEHGENVQINE